MQNVKDIMDTLFNPVSVTKGFYLSGEAGNSKSYEVEKYLNEKSIDFERVTSRVTNLALYFILYKHRDKTILFDDVAFDKAISIDLLKSALNPDSLVSWHTSSEAFSEEVPPSFEFKGKIIVITNEGLKDSRTFYPLLSRCYVLEQNLNIEDYRRIAKIICKNRNVDFKKVEDYLTIWLKHRDLRVVNKACDFINAGKDYLINTLFEEDEELKKLDELIKMHEDKRTIRMIWCSIFDKSKRTFYNRLKEYNEKIKSAEVQKKKDVV